MVTIIRIIGIFLILLALLNLVGLFVIDLNTLVSPAAIIMRYSLMFLAGLGFLFALRWGVLIYFLSVVINWISYFTIYKGQSATSSLWWTIPNTLIIGILSGFTWNRLKWRINPSSK